MKTVEKICKEKFIEWALKERIIADEDEDFSSEPAWLAWKSSWSRSRGVTIEKELQRYREYNKPLSEEKIKELWNLCSQGKEFARLIESAHGIK